MNTAEKLTAIAENQEKVYEAGKKSEYDNFWDNYQFNGERRIYDTAFGTYDTVIANGWNDNNFYPKYPIIATNLVRTFKACNISNLKARLEECGVYLDTSECTNFMQAFSYTSGLGVIPELDLRKATNVGVMFNRANNVVTIEKLIFSETNALTFSETFNYCNSLVNIRIEGKLARTVSFLYSPLSVESMKSIISCLKDYSGTASQGIYILTLKDECKTVLEAEGATSPHGNLWTEYVSDLGWVLA